MIRYLTLPVHRSESIGGNYCLLAVRDAGLAALCRPGMFFELKSGAAGKDRRLFKPVSIYKVQSDEIAFLIKVLGPGTQALQVLEPGAPLKLLGPLGNGFQLVKDSRVLLVSGGVGYPPLAYLRENLDASNEVTFLHGGNCRDDVFPCDDVWTVDGSSGRQGLVTEGAVQLISDKGINVVYSCGPLPMLKALAQIVEPILHYVSLEAYMACGVGVCHGCAVPVGEGYQRVCKEGPVFDASLIRWGEL